MTKADPRDAVARRDPRALQAPRHAFALPDAQVCLVDPFLAPEEAASLFTELLAGIRWRQDTIKLWGKVHDVPRLQQWFADDGMAYTWSGIRMEPEPWNAPLERLRCRLQEALGLRFNTALANLYRDGNDTVGWHADDEPELGEAPTIASISLGATRDFVLRHRTETERVQTISLAHGSLLVMQGDTQKHWRHCVPRRKRVHAPRINLTFRHVTPSTVPDLRGKPSVLRYQSTGRGLERAGART